MHPYDLAALRYSPADLLATVETLFVEASGEPPEGQAAVVHVLLNRLADPRWPDTLERVCHQPGQFSGWDDHNVARLAEAKASLTEELRRDHGRCRAGRPGGALAAQLRAVPDHAEGLTRLRPRRPGAGHVATGFRPTEGGQDVSKKHDEAVRRARAVVHEQCAARVHHLQELVPDQPERAEEDAL